MAIPLLDYLPSSQNQRVQGFEVPSEEHPKIFSAESIASALECEQLMRAAYQQIFNEQQMLVVNRQRGLESQLKNRQITVRDFIRGLLLSDSFRQRNVDVNNNYRLAEMCVQRVLGRDVYSEQEKIAWSIVIATKGMQGFVDELLNSDEYLENFGLDTVPYQRRRILPQQKRGALPHARMPRYGDEHRDRLREMGYFSGFAPIVREPGQSYFVTLAEKVGNDAAFVIGWGLILGAVAIAFVALEIIPV